MVSIDEIKDAYLSLIPEAPNSVEKTITVEEFENLCDFITDEVNESLIS